MAIRTTEELLGSIKERFGEDTSDDMISLIEDVSDTLSDLTTKATDTEDWKKKYEENDAEWRQKYTDRFFNPDPIAEQEKEKEKEMDEPPKLTFESLFS